MAGILPTLPNEDLHRGAITDAPRYRALDWSLTQVRAEPFEIEIDGRDPEPLRVVCDNVQDPLLSSDRSNHERRDREWPIPRHNDSEALAVTSLNLTLWPLPSERKHRHLVTRRNPSIAPLTLAFGVVVHRLLPSGCRAFAACSPPAGTGMACP
jgi:hypothetical protein